MSSFPAFHVALLCNFMQVQGGSNLLELNQFIGLVLDSHSCKLSLKLLQPDQKVRTFQNDGGKEYVNRDVEPLLKQQGIELHKSPYQHTSIQWYG